MWENIYNTVFKGETLQSYVSSTIPILYKIEEKEIIKFSL